MLAHTSNESQPVRLPIAGPSCDGVVPIISAAEASGTEAGAQAAAAGAWVREMAEARLDTVSLAQEEIP